MYCPHFKEANKFPGKGTDRQTKLGFEIVVPSNVDAGIELYRDVVDIHFGSRLHAHLLMLSRNKRSFLMPVDERSTGFGEAFGFPLLQADQLANALSFDFEIVRQRARHHFETMRTFLGSLPQPAVK